MRLTLFKNTIYIHFETILTGIEVVVDERGELRDRSVVSRKVAQDMIIDLLSRGYEIA